MKIKLEQLTPQNKVSGVNTCYYLKLDIKIN